MASIKHLIPLSIRQFVWNQMKASQMVDRPKHTTSLNQANKVLNCMIAYNEYGGYCVPISSKQRIAVQLILKGEVYEPDTINYMRTNCGDGDIIHAGTFFGDFLPGLSSGIGPENKIWAFEPNPENYKCASITKQINQLDQVVLHNAGLGAEPSKAQMMVQNEKGVNLGGASTIVSKDHQKGQLVEIEIASIDNAIPNHRKISIIQLDVEGYEEQALKGAIETIKRCKPIIILENLPDESWLKENILSLGYKATGKLHHNTVFKVE